MRSCEEILNTFKITPTQQRKELLNVMLGYDGLFSLVDLKKETEKVLIVSSEGTIIQTLLLFEMRHLITGRPTERTEKKRGRPVTMYTLNSGVKE